MQHILHPGLSVRQYSLNSEKYEKNVNNIFPKTATKQSNLYEKHENDIKPNQAFFAAQLKNVANPTQQPN